MEYKFNSIFIKICCCKITSKNSTIFFDRLTIELYSVHSQIHICIANKFFSQHSFQHFTGIYSKGLIKKYKNEWGSWILSKTPWNEEFWCLYWSPCGEWRPQNGSDQGKLVLSIRVNQAILPSFIIYPLTHVSLVIIGDGMTRGKELTFSFIIVHFDIFSHFSLMPTIANDHQRLPNTIFAYLCRIIDLDYTIILFI